MDIEQLLASLNPDIIVKFKLAIETGKWANGIPLTQQQRDTCMQAVIAYEHRHVSQQQRTGYVPPKKTPCADKNENEQVVKWSIDK